MTDKGQLLSEITKKLIQEWEESRIEKIIRDGTDWGMKIDKFSIVDIEFHLKDVKNQKRLIELFILRCVLNGELITLHLFDPLEIPKGCVQPLEYKYIGYTYDVCYIEYDLAGKFNNSLSEFLGWVNFSSWFNEDEGEYFELLELVREQYANKVLEKVKPHLPEVERAIQSREDGLELIMKSGFRMCVEERNMTFPQ